MKVLAWVAMVVVALVVLIPPADAKRGGGDDGRGCSKKDWRYVLEGSDPDFRLCLLAREDR